MMDDRGVARQHQSDFSHSQQQQHKFSESNEYNQQQQQQDDTRVKSGEESGEQQQQQQLHSSTSNKSKYTNDPYKQQSSTSSSSTLASSRQQQVFGASSPQQGIYQKGVSIFSNNINKSSSNTDSKNNNNISHVVVNTTTATTSSSQSNNNNIITTSTASTDDARSKSVAINSATSSSNSNINNNNNTSSSGLSLQKTGNGNASSRFNAKQQLLISKLEAVQSQNNSKFVTCSQIKQIAPRKHENGFLFKYLRTTTGRRPTTATTTVNSVKSSSSTSNSIIKNNNEIDIKQEETGKDEQQQSQSQSKSSSTTASILNSTGSGSSSHPQLSSTSKDSRHGSSSDCKTNHADVGNSHMAGQVIDSSSSSGMAQDSSKPSGSSTRHKSDALHHQGEETHKTVDSISLCVGDQKSCISSGNGTINSGSEQLHEGNECCLCFLSNQTRSTLLQLSVRIHDVESTRNFCSSCVVNLFGLQNCFSLGGHRQSDEGKDHLQSSSKSTTTTKRSCDSMGNWSENKSLQAVQSDGLHGGSRSGTSSNDGNVKKSLEEDEKWSKTLSKNNTTNVQMAEEVSSNSKPQLSLLQGDSTEQIGRVGSGGSSGSSSHPVGGQTSRSSTSSLPRLDNSLHHQESRSCQDVGNSKCNETSLESIAQEYFEFESSFAPSHHFNNNTNNNIFSSSSSSCESKYNNNNNNYNENNNKKSPTHHNNNNKRSSSSSDNHSMLRRTNKTNRVANKEEQLKYKLHSYPIPALNRKRLERFMSDSHRKQLKELEHRVFHESREKLLKQIESDPHYYNKIKQMKNSSCLPKYCETLGDHGLTTPLSRDELHKVTGVNIPFVIVEEKEKGFRLRFILWTKEINDILKDYKANVNLDHSSFYIDVAAEDCAVTADMKISFYQYEIPEEYRYMFAFCDSEGNWYTLNRLPMGFRPSVEIMQLICETMSLQPNAVQPSATITTTDDNNNTIEETIQLTSLRTKHRSWVDGFQVAGAEEECRVVMEKIKKVSDYVGVTWKDDGVELLQEYDFIGIHFNHKLHQVSVAEKTLLKLPSKITTTKQYLTTELESLLSRLYFCSGVLRIIPADYYFTIKQINRYISRLNKTGIDQNNTLPGSVVSSLNQWIREARSTLTLLPDIESNKNKNEQKKKNTAFDVLFVDASLYGWGAFYIGADGIIAISGAAWKDGIKKDEELTADKIAELEGVALNFGLQTFEERLSLRKNVDIRIDNTSLMYGTRKGKSKSSPSLNHQIKLAVHFLKSRNFSFTVAYVNTSENWADHPSRNDYSKIPTRTQVSQILNSNRGIYGRQSKVVEKETSVSVITHLTNIDEFENNNNEDKMMIT